MARLITEEMGCPITQARSIQVVAPVDIIDSYLQTAQDYPFREVRRSLKGATALVVREPVGVVAAVTPWNVPLGIPLAEDRPGAFDRLFRGPEAGARDATRRVLPQVGAPVPGSPEAPLTWGDLVRQFGDCAAAAVSPPTDQRIETAACMAQHLEEFDDVTELVRLLG